MNRSVFNVIAFLCSVILLSCSDNADKDESAATSSATTNPASATRSVEAKEKKTDVALQGLKGRVELMSESVSYPGKNKKSASKNVYKYDDKGNRIELANRTGDKINSIIKSVYADNRLIREETILGSGAVDMISEIKTDPKGNKIEQRDVRQNTSTPLFNYTYYYKYDEKGQLIERTAYRGNGTFLFRYSFTYDVNGNRTEWIQTGSDSTIAGKVTYKYDDKNNLIEQSEYDKTNTLKATYTFTYAFDRKDNWIRQTKMQNGSPVEIRERTLSYF